MNRITLSGRLVREPEEGFTKNNKNWTKFSLAVKRPFTKNEADFFECMSYGTTASYVSKYLEKGDYVIITGSVSINSYTDKNGNTKKSTSVNVDSVEKVGGKKDSSEEEKESVNNPLEDLPSDELSDDELPF